VPRGITPAGIVASGNAVVHSRPHPGPILTSTNHCYTDRRSTRLLASRSEYRDSRVYCISSNKCPYREHPRYYLPTGWVYLLYDPDAITYPNVYSFLPELHFELISSSANKTKIKLAFSSNDSIRKIKSTYIHIHRRHIYYRRAFRTICSLYFKRQLSKLTCEKVTFSRNIKCF